jgi:ribonuclease T
METSFIPLEKRFRGYLPVVIDIETAGFNPKKNALLENSISIGQELIIQ